MTGNDDYGHQALPDGWTWTTIGEVAKPERIRVKPQDYPELPYIGMEDVESETMRLVGTKPAGEMKSTSEYFRANDVLYGRLRPYLNKVYRPEFEGLCSAEFIVFREVQYLESKYLQYFLNQWSFVAYINMLNTGDRPRVKFSQMADYPFPLPPVRQQLRIVNEIEKQFTRLDAAVASLQRVQTNLERYKASVLKAACEGRLVPQDPGDEPAERLLERILAERRRKWEEEEWEKLIEKARKKAAQAKRKKAGRPSRIKDLETEEWQELPEEEYGKYLPKNDKWKQKYQEPERPDTSELPELPAGWVWATPDQLSLRIVDCLHSTPKFEKNGYLCVDTNCIEPGRIIVERARFVNEKTFHERNRRMVPRVGDVLLSREGALLGIAVMVPENLEFCLGQRMMEFRPAEGVDAKYFESVLNSLIFKAQYKMKITGTASPHLNIRDIRQIGIPLPPRGQQVRIANEIEAQLSIVSEIEKDVDMNLNRSIRLQQAILYKAFSGRLIPQDPNDEPASALLARLGDGSHLQSRKAKKPDVSDEAHQPNLL